ncbi:putative homeobox domain-containing protein [Vairimorpha apis BRL 01]|uniref:Putative homeobox domain-containing protein n=1 Tax=Vairimorpha apis BRL 01 TaxID=1037528 RepID=T0LCG3_9MICR|nr:putative homeobox domain-containing protein [Vairimorpha apis BRL 01]
MNRYIKDEEVEAIFGLLKLKQKHRIKQFIKAKKMTRLQTRTLLHVYALCNYPNVKLIEDLSILLNLNSKFIAKWFFDYNNLFQRKLSRQSIHISSCDLLIIYYKEKSNIYKQMQKNKINNYSNFNILN